MQEVCAHTKVCLARLWERLRRAAELPLDLAQDGLHHHCSDAAESAMAAHWDAEHRDGLVLERCRGEPAQERLAEIPAMDDPDPGQMESQNLLDIADLSAARRWAYIRQEWQQVDELLANRAARASYQTQQAARK